MANLDALNRFPDQNAEHRFEECVGETIADLLGNQYQQPFDPDFSYAAAFAFSGRTPSDQGETLRSAMYGACAFGGLPDKDSVSTSAQTSTLYQADFSHYTLQQKQLAAYFKQNGMTWINSYYDAEVHFNKVGTGCALSFKWYESFNSPNPDGTLRVPDYANEPFSFHCVAGYEGTLQGIRIKPWEGQNYGAGGYSFMPYGIFTACLTGGAAFDPTAWPWLTLVRGALTYPHNISNLLPLIMQR